MRRYWPDASTGRKSCRTVDRNLASGKDRSCPSRRAHRYFGRKGQASFVQRFFDRRRSLFGHDAWRALSGQHRYPRDIGSARLPSPIRIFQKRFCIAKFTACLKMQRPRESHTGYDAPPIHELRQNRSISWKIRRIEKSDRYCREARCFGAISPPTELAMNGKCR